MDIIEFLNGNGIIVGEDNFPKGNKKKYTWDIEYQVALIVEIEKILMGKKVNIIPRIESSIGREMESFIVQAKKTFKMINSLKDKENKNDFDFFVIEQGEKILKRANKTLDSLDEAEYLKIIIRSMNNYEICLGRVDEGNLKREGMEISIRTTRYISYNMIEHDCYNYIKRLRKRGYNQDISKIINEFAYKAKLNNDSIKYMTVLANYPVESIKMLLKLKYDRARFTNEEWVREIEMTQKIDGIELL